MKKNQDTLQDQALLLRHLAAATRAGSALPPVTRLLAQDAQLPRATRRAYADTAQALEQGAGLGQALQQLPAFSSPDTAAWLQGTEGPHQQADTLQALAADTELRVRGRTDLALLLIWPSSLASAACALFVSMLMFVVPSMREGMEAIGHELPALTRAVFDNGPLQWLLIGWQPALIVALLLLCMFARHLPAGWTRRLADAGHASGLTRRLGKAELAVRALAILRASAGSSIQPAAALGHLASTTGPTPLKKAAQELQAAIAAGHSWSKAFETAGVLPQRYALHLAVAEQAHDASMPLPYLQAWADTEWAEALARLDRTFVFALYACVGSLIGTLLVSIYLPILKLGQML